MDMYDKVLNMHRAINFFSPFSQEVIGPSRPSKITSKKGPSWWWIFEIKLNEELLLPRGYLGIQVSALAFVRAQSVGCFRVQTCKEGTV